MSIRCFAAAHDADSDRRSRAVGLNLLAVVVWIGCGATGVLACVQASDPVGDPQPVPFQDAGPADSQAALPEKSAGRTDSNASVPSKDASLPDGTSPGDDGGKPNPDPADEDAGHPREDGGDAQPVNDDGGLGWLSCMRDSDEGYVPEPAPPFSPAQPGACSQAELEAHRECLKGTARAPCPKPPEISEACHECLFPTLASGAPWGPWEVRPHDLVRINGTGCFENLVPGAGQKERDYALCIAYLCEPCPAGGRYSCGVSAQLQGRCDTWAAQRRTLLERHPELLECLYDHDPSWIGHALRVGELWCGPAGPTDASALSLPW